MDFMTNDAMTRPSMGLKPFVPWTKESCVIAPYRERSDISQTMHSHMYYLHVQMDRTGSCC